MGQTPLKRWHIERRDRGEVKRVRLGYGRPMTNRGALGLYEFFAGGGLAGIGLSGFETLLANDIDAMKAAAWRDNHPAQADRFRLADVWALRLDDLPGQADVAWASSPCQDLSLAGRRGGLAAQRSGAFWGFWRLVEGLIEDGRAPRMIVIENVMGLLSSSGGEDFQTLCAALAKGGYRFGAIEADAALWLPQSRPRLFIIAARDGEAVTSNSPGAFHTDRIRAAHGRLSQELKSRWVWWSMAPPPRRNVDLATVLEPDDAVEWLPALQTAQLLDMLAPLQRARLDAIIATGERRVGAGYRRVRREPSGKVQRLELRFDGLAGCLRTPAGGSSRQFVIVAEGAAVKVRKLTGREAARLMGLADSYRLPRSEIAALKLAGDAVAVPVVMAISEQILKPTLAAAQAAA
jgi:DNA (cytosine-5)-methyltransferase 1